jgi:hypothetical protein
MWAPGGLFLCIPLWSKIVEPTAEQLCGQLCGPEGDTPQQLVWDAWRWEF